MGSSIRKIISSLVASAVVVAPLISSPAEQYVAFDYGAEHVNLDNCYLHDDDECCCEEPLYQMMDASTEDYCDDRGKGVSIALLDAGVTDYTTKNKVSFVDDDSVDSNHGNDMMKTILSIAPSVDVLDVRVLDDYGIGEYSTVEKGIRWAVDNNADIIVMSFAGADRSSLIEDALAYAEDKNVLVVASAGNNSSDEKYYPAAYPNVISVGATDVDGNVQGFSNYGESVDTYVQWENGTSGAAQFIAAFSSLLIQEKPGITISEIRELFNANDNVDVIGNSETNADSLVYACATCKNHDYSKFVRNTVAATCITDGYAIYQCSRCTATTTKKIPAFNHNWGTWSTKSQATCTSAECQTRKCKICGKEETQYVGRPLGHSWSNWSTTQNATCVSVGYQRRTCSRCKISENRQYGPNGHYMGEWKTDKPATCTSPEKQIKKCYNCSYSETQYVGIPRGHNCSTTKVPATTTSTGLITYRCTRSGCNYVSYTTIPMIGTITIPKEYSGNDNLYFHADGTADHSQQPGIMQYGNYVRIKFNTNVDWTVSSSPDYVKVMDKNLNIITSGKKGDNEVLIGMYSFPETLYSNSRSCILTIKANDTTKKFYLYQSNYTINGMTKSNYISQANIRNYINLLGTTSDGAKTLKGEKGINTFSVFNLGENRRMAVCCNKIGPSEVEINYAVFLAKVTKGIEEIQAEIVLQDTKGMRLEQDGNIFTTTLTINNTYSAITNELQQNQIRFSQKCLDGAQTLWQLYLTYQAPGSTTLGSFVFSEVSGSALDTVFSTVIQQYYTGDKYNPVTANGIVHVPYSSVFKKNGDNLYIYAKSCKKLIQDSTNTISLTVVDINSGRRTPVKFVN